MPATFPTLVAKQALYEEVGDPRVLVAAVAECADGSGFRLEFQRAWVFDQQDQRSGMDTYCLCTGDGATHYGGVETINVSGSSIDIELNASASSALGMPKRFLLRLAVPEVEVVRFNQGLRRVLGMT